MVIDCHGMEAEARLQQLRVQQVRGGCTGRYLVPAPLARHAATLALAAYKPSIAVGRRLHIHLQNVDFQVRHSTQHTVMLGNSNAKTSRK